MTDASEPEVTVESKTSSKGRSMLNTIKEYKELIVGISALIAGLAGVIKPTDTAATESSFQWTQKELEQVAADNKQTHADLVALHQYLVAYIKGQKKLQAFQLEQLIEDEPPAPITRRPIRRTGRTPTTAHVTEVPEIQQPMQEAQQMLEQLPDLPKLKSQPYIMKKETFDSIIEAAPQE